MKCLNNNSVFYIIMEQNEIISTNQEEEEIKRKQEFLRKEILDKDYDQSAFVEFCVSIKEKGDDLASWTFEELESIIEKTTLKPIGKIEQIIRNLDSVMKKFAKKKYHTMV